VPGRLDVGDGELELHPTAGHTADGMAVLAPWAGVLIVGDYLSPVEIPRLEGGSLQAYLDTLARLEQLLAGVEHIVVGHGGALERERALALLQQDRAYLEELYAARERAQPPPGRRTAEQRRVHERNVAALG
jgi:glyoxylase-like metal-dependent hydrolase (beta-lactamase superfamily II)